MRADNQDYVLDYTNKREAILSQIRTITNQTKINQPDRSQQSYYRRYTAKNVEVYFDRALDNLLRITPEISFIRQRNTKKSQEKTDAAIRAEIEKHLAFLSDLEPVMENICKLQSALLDNNSDVNLQETLTELKTSIDTLKTKHNDDFRKAKFYTNLTGGIAILTAVLFITLPLALIFIHSGAALPALWATTAIFLASYIGGYHTAIKNQNKITQSFFLDATVKKVADMQIDYPELAPTVS